MACILTHFTVLLSSSQANNGIVRLKLHHALLYQNYTKCAYTSYEYVTIKMSSTAVQFVALLLPFGHKSRAHANPCGFIDVKLVLARGSFFARWQNCTKPTISFVISVCPHATIRLRPDGFSKKKRRNLHEFLFSRKSVEKIQVSLKSYRNNLYFTSRRLHI